MIRRALICAGDRVLRRDDGTMIDLTPEGERVDLDADRAIIFTGDGKVLFSHLCDRHERGILRCAPELQIGRGHTVATRTPLTIVASILCPDCGAHGFVTDGTWRGV